MRRAFLVAALAALMFLLAGCPAVRHGVAGQLDQAQQQCESSTATAILAMNLYQTGKATSAIVSTTLAEARDKSNSAYKRIATLTARSEDDLTRQRQLSSQITTAIGAINDANAVVGGVDTTRTVSQVRQDLINVHNWLARGPSQ